MPWSFMNDTAVEHPVVVSAYSAQSVDMQIHTTTMLMKPTSPTGDSCVKNMALGINNHNKKRTGYSMSCSFSFSSSTGFLLLRSNLTSKYEPAAHNNITPIPIGISAAIGRTGLMTTPSTGTPAQNK